MASPAAKEGEAAGRAAGRIEGEAVGRAEGDITGERRKLISIVRKLSVKNMSAEAIADMLEEDEELVGEIHHLLRLHPDWEDSRIYQEL